MTGEDALAFFDAIAPIVHRESIDIESPGSNRATTRPGPGGSGDDYINCPLTREQYAAFVDALIAGDKTSFHEWEASTPYFDGCLPIEVMAARGPETLRHGPMKPFGLTNPHDPQVKAYAVVQLRQDNKLGTLFNMVGFQTKLKHAEQVRVFRTIPGLEKAEFARLGGLHRNTFLNPPKLLDATLRLKADAAAAFRRADHRLRRLCGIRRHRLARRALRRRRAAGRRASAAAADHRAWRAARAYHRRAYGDDRCRPALVPADEHQFRPVSAVDAGADKDADGKRLRGPEKTIAKKRALCARARRSRALGRRRPSGRVPE